MALATWYGGVAELVADSNRMLAGLCLVCQAPRPIRSNNCRSRVVASAGASSQIAENYYSEISVLSYECEGYTAHQIPIKFNELNLSEIKQSFICRNQTPAGWIGD